LLPPEAQRRRRLAQRLLDHFVLNGYELVTPPAFELADVLERGLGALDPRDVLRFVEPESGEVAALRPDVTPQIARLAATRLMEKPPPMRLCYEGTVLRRRQERARRHRQILQAGVELLGVRGPAGDVEIMTLAVGSARAARLSSFVLDLGHADIARALLGELPLDQSTQLLQALAHKDGAALAQLARRAGKGQALVDALSELPRLHGDRAVWKEAERLLEKTPAAPALFALRDLWDRAAAEGLESFLRVDLGEVRGFAYYTGAIFHLFAEGPGEPIGSGGRYDDLLGRFGAPMPAAGFALDLDNLAWALRIRGEEERPAPRVLVQSPRHASALCAALRTAGVGCASGPESDGPAYARAWGFSHVLDAPREGAPELLDTSTGTRVPLAPGAEADVALQVLDAIEPGRTL
jgi:ATP phosphoribosyltransferase regulatory subunit